MPVPDIALLLSCAVCCEDVAYMSEDSCHSLKSWGYCQGCGLPFCAEHLFQPSFLVEEPWAVQYSGFECQRCYNSSPPASAIWSEADFQAET